MFFRKDKNDGHKDHHPKDHFPKKPANGQDGDELFDPDYLEDQFPKDFKKVMEIIEDTKKKVSEMYADNIKELKEEIKELKVERNSAYARLWDIVNKLVDKPVSPTATQAYLAAKSQQTGNTNVAGPKGKLP